MFSATMFPFHELCIIYEDEDFLSFNFPQFGSGSSMEQHVRAPCIGKKQQLDRSPSTQQGEKLYNFFLSGFFSNLNFSLD